MLSHNKYDIDILKAKQTINLYTFFNNTKVDIL